MNQPRVQVDMQKDAVWLKAAHDHWGNLRDQAARAEGADTVRARRIFAAIYQHAVTRGITELGDDAEDDRTESHTARVLASRTADEAGRRGV